ncbi:MAG: hypothetical protein AB7L41_06165 [Flavobacteriaceae bacterium]
MTDISITAANVVKGANAVTESGIAGATITAGQAVYLDSATGKYKLADSNDATAAVRQPRGIALNGASDGQPLTIQKSGDITIGATLTAGVAYYLSDTAGGICPVADVGSGEYACIIGIAESTSVLHIAISYSGVAL